MSDELSQDDESFLGYVDLHCTTERALFSGRDVIRLHKLAEVDVPDVDEGSFYAMHEDLAQPLLELVRTLHPPKPPVRRPTIVGWILLQGILDPQTKAHTEWRLYAIYPDKAAAQVESMKLAGRTRIVECDLTSLYVNGYRRLRPKVFVEDSLFEFDLSDLKSEP
jgi:hypothetical protein